MAVAQLGCTLSSLGACAQVTAFPCTLVVKLQPEFSKKASTCNGKTYNLGSTTSFGKLFPWLMHLPRNCFSSLKEIEVSAGSLPALLSAAALLWGPGTEALLQRGWET